MNKEEPKNVNAKYLSWRTAPGYRWFEALVEIDGKEVWLHFDKDQTTRLNNDLADTLKLAGKDPLDK